MIDTYEAWVVEQSPIFSRLPECYRDNEVTPYLTTFWDDLLISTKSKVDDIPRQLDPGSCDESWLDFLAPLCGFSGIYWDKSWNSDFKRNLLVNSYTQIWNNKGSNACLSNVLNCFYIPNVITNKGNFIFGYSKFGQDQLGVLGWQYTIYLNTKFKTNSNIALVNKLNNLFGPCWCTYEIVFDDNVVQDYVNLDATQLILRSLL